MRVLLIHNFYQSGSPSGEDNVYIQERRLLQERGVEVVPYERHNDTLRAASFGKLAGAAVDTVWSRSAYRDISALIERERPDVAHAHNTFPQISPSAYSACAAYGIPIVQTLHNYRTICPGALLMRELQPCESCVGTSLLPALMHRCYRDSLPATATLSAMLAWHRLAGTYQKQVSRYVVLTDFAAGRFKAGGLPAERISVRPNFLADPPQVGGERGGYALFVGRLTAEKGVHTLLAAWRSPDSLPPLKIVGDGQLRAELEERARQAGANVEFLGTRSRSHVLELMRGAEVLIVPSECYEGFPLVVVEAFACGTPVVASDLGGLRELIIDGMTGWRFPRGDSAALAAAVTRTMAEPNVTAGMRCETRARFEAHYTAERAFDGLMKIYGEVIGSRPQPGFVQVNVPHAS